MTGYYEGLAGEEGKAAANGHVHFFYSCSTNIWRKTTRFGTITRRVLIALLVLAIYYFLGLGLYRKWYHPPRNVLRVSLSDGPIRGSKRMKQLGTRCLDRHGQLQETSSSGTPSWISSRHAIVIDAGSTGSRVHVYEFQFCGRTLESVVDELFHEVKPGLSSFDHDPPKAALSLQPLIERALQRVPKAVRECTPLALRATAGLRLLSSPAVDSILGHIRSSLKHHPFLLGGHQSDSVMVMDGSDEAVFAWATVNFLQEKFVAPEALNEPHHPRGMVVETAVVAAEQHKDLSVVMDLGGASTQIVFAVDPANLPPKDSSLFKRFYYELLLHEATVPLYQQSHLGFGLMEARKAVKRQFLAEHISQEVQDRQSLWFPCWPQGWQNKFAAGEHLNGTELSHDLVGNSAGWGSCIAITKPILKMDEPCANPPCSFNGVHQPKLQSRSLVAFSYIYDRLVPLGLTSPTTLFDIEREGKKLCRATIDGSDRYARLLKEEPEWCLDVAYIWSLLRIGYQISMDQKIVLTKQINGYEAGWSLGAALKLLEQVPDYCDVQTRSFINQTIAALH